MGEFFVIQNLFSSLHKIDFSILIVVSNVFYIKNSSSKLEEVSL